MRLKGLSIKGVRNLSDVTLSGCGQVNLIYGDNGAGKTAVLEALHILCLGRSFKSHKFSTVISSPLDEAVVFAHGYTSETSVATQVGVRRSRRAAPEAKVDGSKIDSLAKLALLTPLQLLDASSFQLVEGSPTVRRAFLDWGVFHVEHRFNLQWQILRKCVKQRNTLLRRGKIDYSVLSAWDHELCRAAELVDEYRRLYIEQLTTEFQQLAVSLADVPPVSLEYKRGWPEACPLKEALADAFERDSRVGHTSVGPHRADITMMRDGVPVAECLSRGQEKTLICMLKLAQVALLKRETGKSCLFLIDDFAAELDSNNRRRLCGLLQDLDSQVFITGIDSKDLVGFWHNEADTRLFHVEHGQITAVNDTADYKGLD